MEYPKLWLLPDNEKPRNRVVGVLGDIHAPFIHKKYIKFAVDKFAENGVTDIVCIGDLVDNHAVSRHETEPNAMGAKAEYRAAKRILRQLIREFPVMKICMGNHDKIPQRQAKTIGLYNGFLKNFHEAWELPTTWEVRTSFKIRGVKYQHGTRFGKTGSYNAAFENGISIVQGHSHRFANVQYISNERGLTFGMNVGTGIDVDAYSQAYAKEFPLKPIVSVGIVYNSKEAKVIPMNRRY